MWLKLYSPEMDVNNSAEDVNNMDKIYKSVSGKSKEEMFKKCRILIFCKNTII